MKELLHYIDWLIDHSGSVNVDSRDLAKYINGGLTNDAQHKFLMSLWNRLDGSILKPDMDISDLVQEHLSHYGLEA